jgi:hypothetical protein
MSKLLDLQEEISGYRLPKKVASAMLALGELGFEFGGHGTSLTGGGEDFSLDKQYGRNPKNYATVNFCVNGRKVAVGVSFWANGEETVSFDSTLDNVAQDVLDLGMDTAAGFHYLIKHGLTAARLHWRNRARW